MLFLPQNTMNRINWNALYNMYYNVQKKRARPKKGHALLTVEQAPPYAPALRFILPAASRLKLRRKQWRRAVTAFFPQWRA